MNTKSFHILLTVSLSLVLSSVHAQQVTGVWRGRIDKKKVEVKIVQKGDSLTGTSYYYESAGHYKRYSIKGYFDPVNNSVVWWDDQLISDKGGPNKNGLLSVADFNCPGGGVMKLDGKASSRDGRENPKASVNLTKVPDASFNDEWDFVIGNYTVGANDPEIIDSIGLIAFNSVQKPVVEQKLPPPVETVRTPPAQKTEPLPMQTIEEKFVIRKKVFHTEIPIEGDSIELRFFDNVQVDGDSITLFLNDKMVFTHIRLIEKAYIIKFALKDLNDTNELTMVAENLGSIPPNTAYMVAIVGGKHYDVNLSSTEETSAMIRLKKRVR